jgi:phosphoglycerol transferase MdoB-like AlkP superfamily enzyme
LSAREEFWPGRPWSKNPKYSQYPLWQERVAAPNEMDADSAKTRDKLAAYLKAEENAKGPWNVVVVLLKSAQASDIGYLNPPGTKSLAPGLDTILSEGVSFTEAIASGSQSMHGQIAALCSLYSFPSFPLMITAPMTNARCLPDIFYAKGYETYFFHAADNQLDNRDVFYQHHRTGHIVGKADYAEGASEAAWGYSDHALFDKALFELKKSRVPFYATILSLSNQPPFRLPSDAPSQINQGQSEREQVFNYMDWAFSTFYREFIHTFPHTIMVVLADQGITYGDQIDAESGKYAAIRNKFRIPFAILTAQMPLELQGKKLSTLVSNVDAPPTILSLLGSTETEQQFMGSDAFSRTNQPIYANWLETFLRISMRADGPLVENVPQPQVDAITAIGQYNLYAPSEK